MKRMQKGISLLLVLVMTLSCITGLLLTTAAAAPASGAASVKLEKTS